MENRLLKQIDETYRLAQKDCGEFASFTAGGMNFTNARFEAEGLGSVSTMDAAGMQGMTMRSVILNPFLVDAPLLSIDRIQAMGMDMLFLEMFDSTVGKGIEVKGLNGIAEKYGSLADQPAAPHWYDGLRVGVPVLKRCTAADSPRIDELIAEYLAAYLAACGNAAACDEQEKRKKAAVYSEGLLTNGGPATDPVVASLGKEKTGEFFRKVLFATEK